MLYTCDVGDTTQTSEKRRNLLAQTYNCITSSVRLLAQRQRATTTRNTDCQYTHVLTSYMSDVTTSSTVDKEVTALHLVYLQGADILAKYGVSLIG